jgi:FtsH-binding integral membrane protein
MLLSAICSFFEPMIVFIAIVSCGIVVLAITVYALTAKIDFSMVAGIAIVFFVSLILFIIAICTFDYKTSVMFYTYASILVFGIYILIDIIAIRGDKGRGIGLDYYVAAAVMLYVDIVILFIYILRAVKGN